jgi:hypothetical protein
MIKKLILILLFVNNLYSNEYQEWLKSEKQEYNNYVKTIDEEFTDMLKEEWKFYQTLTENSTYKKSKPTTIPVLKKELTTTQKEIKNSKVVDIKPIKKNQFKEYKKILIDENQKVISFEYFGENIKINIDKNINFKMMNISKENILSFWKYMSKTNYQKLISQIEKYSNNLNLNDWAKYLLINKVSNEIFNYKPLNTLFNWFVLSKLNYDVKIGFNKNKIFLLSNINHTVFQISFFYIDNKRYYVITPNARIDKVGEVSTYKGDYNPNSKALSFEQKNIINLKKNIISKNFSFNFQNQSFEVNAKYNKNLIDFYKTFPQSNYQIYTKSQTSDSLNSSILNNLKEILKNKTELEAINILLRFTQKAFKYKTDQQQFGYEKVFFPEETIFYPYSDCEDKSIFFNFLVKKLFGLNTLLIKYPDHLAAAVEFSTQIFGDSFKYKNKKFIITDPTYINANAGMSMPQYKNIKFEIIDTKL